MKQLGKVERNSNYMPGPGWQQGLLQVTTLNILSLVWSALVFWEGSRNTVNLVPEKKFSLRIFPKQHFYLKETRQMKTHTQCFLVLHFPSCICMYIYIFFLLFFWPHWHYSFYFEENLKLFSCNSFIILTWGRVNFRICHPVNVAETIRGAAAVTLGVGGEGGVGAGGQSQ